MATIPLWLLGKHLVSLSLFPQTISSVGVLSDASTKAIVSQVDSFQLNMSANGENINAVNQPRANHVVVEDDFNLSIGLIEKHDASDPDSLATVFLTNEVFKCVFVKGTQAGSIATWTFYGKRVSHSNGINGKGKQVVNFELNAVDVGSTAYMVRAVS